MLESRPKIDPPVMFVVGDVVMKSSAVSISIFPPEDGRDAVPIRLVGPAVLKKKLAPNPVDIIPKHKTIVLTYPPVLPIIA